MKIFTQLSKTVLVNLFVIVMIILIALFPRHLDIIVEPNGIIHQEYNFTFERYWENIRSFLIGIKENKSLGESRYGTTAEEEIRKYMPNSLLVILSAFLLSSILGTLKGFFDYKSTKTKKNIWGNGTTWLLQSIPDFLLLLLIQWVIIWHFPFIRFFSREGWDAFTLPALIVSLYPTMYIARITSASLAAQDGQLYILVAKAKGLTDRLILYKHIFLNSIGTILTHLPSLMLYLLSNLLIVEYLMLYPGAAQRLFKAIDYSVSVGTGANYEPGVVIGISVCFMLLLLLVQIISQLATRYFQPQ